MAAAATGRASASRRSSGSPPTSSAARWTPPSTSTSPRGLIFLKYISDAIEAQRTKLLAQPGADPEDRDEYTANNLFWVPKEARWAGDDGLQAMAKQPTIGLLIDKAMDAVEKDNPGLKRVLPKDYASPDLDKTRLGELIDLVGTIGLGDTLPVQNVVRTRSLWTSRRNYAPRLDFASSRLKNGVRTPFRTSRTFRCGLTAKEHGRVSLESLWDVA